MFRNYVKIAFRNIKRNKTFSVINILGLAAGMASSILIFLWIQDELSYDRFFNRTDDLFRVTVEQYSSGQVTTSAITQFPLAPSLENDFPEIENSSRMLIDRYPRDVKYGNKLFSETSFIYADSSFFKMFSFPFVEGNPETALLNPYSVIITERIADKYFGNKDPVGEVLMIDYYNGLTAFSVTGVIKNIPHNTHLQFEFLIPFHIFSPLYKDVNVWETVDNYYSYVLLNENSSAEELNIKVAGYLQKHIPESSNKIILQAVTGIHLFSDIKFDSMNNSDIKLVYFFSLIAVFILLIACINFMNLSTARSEKRSKEVGLRKVSGARKTQIIRQFFGESLMYIIIALFFALILVELLRPVFNNLSDKQLVINYSDTTLIMVILGIVIFTLLVAGSYTSLFLSSFVPVNILRGGISKIPKSFAFRKVLVVIQFSLSIILIISTIIVSNQLKYLRKKNLGFKKENLIYIPAKGLMVEKYENIKEELLKKSDITGVTASNILPMHGNENPLENWEGNTTEERILINLTAVDYDYFETFDINMSSGRSFSKDYPSDSSAIIINEEAVRQMNLKDPLGKWIFSPENRIIGVVEDYHYMNLENMIEPIFLKITKRARYFIFIRIKYEDRDLENLISFIKNTFYTFEPDYPIQYQFLDARLEMMYVAEEKVEKLFSYFAFLAIFISCLGLFGLSSFMTEQRTKEIGVRKVVGASIPDLVILLSRDFLKWVILSFIIACPVAYIAMSSWLQNYAYKTNITWWMFILAGIIALIVAFLTVSYQTFNVSRKNPIEALRYE